MHIFKVCLSRNLLGNRKFNNYGAVVPWCSGYHYGTTSFSKSLMQVMLMFKSCLRRVGDLQCWELLTVVLAGNKTWRLSSVDHSAKAIHHSSSSSSSSPILSLSSPGRGVSFTIQERTNDLPRISDTDLPLVSEAKNLYKQTYNDEPQPGLDLLSVHDTLI